MLVASRAKVPLTLTVFCAALVITAVHMRAPDVNAAPPQFNQNSAFLGQWCAQGDRNKQASITANGMSLTVTNEQGSSSIANYQGMNQNTIVSLFSVALICRM